MKYDIEESTGLAFVKFDDGLETLYFDTNLITDEVSNFLWQYGVQQFLQDAAAPAKTKAAEVGEDNVEVVRRRLVERKIQMLLAGKTSLDRADAGRSTYLTKAIMALYGKTEKEVETILEAKTVKEIKSLEANPQIALKIAEYREAAAMAKKERLASAAATVEALPII